MSQMRSPAFVQWVPALIAALLIGLPAQAQYSGGTGQANDPYRIASAADLIALSGSPGDYDKAFVLVADIDLNPNLPGNKVFTRAVISPDTDDTQDWFQGTAFTGTFDGGGHTISRLTIQGAGIVGLFGQLAPSARVSNLVLDAVEITSTGEDVGGLAGLSGGTIAMVSSSGSVTAWAVVGGLVGRSWGSISGSRASGSVRGNAGYVGGLVGVNYYDEARRPGRITDSSSSSSVTGVGGVGGLVGWNAGTGIIAKGSSTGPVSGVDSVGGLVGSNDGSIGLSFSTGSVSGSAAVGGLAGYNGGSIATTYSAGWVVGTGDYVGGLVGGSGAQGVVQSSFWDTQASGQATSTGGTGKTTSEMQTAQTFLAAGWDFVGETGNGTEDVWRIDEGIDRPKLRSESTGGEWSVSKTVVPPAGGLGKIAPGDTVTYSILVSTYGLTTGMTGVEVVDYLPDEVIFLAAEAGQVTGLYDAQGHAFTWVYPSLPPGSALDLRIMVTVRPDVAPGTTVTNLVAISSAETSPRTASAAFTTDASTTNTPEFTDAALKAAVERALNVQDPNAWDMLKLTELDLTGKGITDLSGLESATNLKWLYAQGNQIAGLGALSGLAGLERLYLTNNPLQESAFQVLSGLVSLQFLQLDHTNDGIDNIPPEWATNLTGLRVLNLRGNQRLQKRDPWVPAMRMICEGNGGSLLVDD